MLKKIFWFIVAIALLGLVGYTLVMLKEKSEVKPVLYSSTSPFTADIIKKTVATGSVVPRLEVAIKPNVSGIVEELFVEPGQAIAKGARVARIRIVPNMVNLASAEARVDRAEIALEDATNEFERSQELYEQGLASQTEYQAADIALRQASQELQAAKDNYSLVREGALSTASSSTNTVVTSTTDGMVLEVPIEEGDSVIESNTFNDGTTIATVANMDEMIFKGEVDESEVGKLSEGMDLVLKVGAIEGETFPALLEHIAPKGVEDGGAIQFGIRAEIQLGSDQFLRANYSANADIVLERVDQVMAVQEAWLQFDDGAPYVEVETGEQQYERRDVELGLSDGIQVEVVSGLAMDDLIKDPNSASS